MHGMYDELLSNLAILVLSGFVGFAVISKVPNTLHTPLMSGTNAIHGIVVLGALVVFGEVEHPSLAVQIILFVAVVFGTLNVIGGFIVTDRMLGMFKGKKACAAGQDRGAGRQMNYLVIGLYVISFALFIYGLMGLTGPKTAVRGNLIAAVGMALAVTATLIKIRHTDQWPLIIAGLVVGVVLGVPPARYTKMTAMPQLVAFFNGVGGGTVALIALAEFMETNGFSAFQHGESPTVHIVVASLFAAIIGSISFWGSIIAFGKLQEILSGIADRPRQGAAAGQPAAAGRGRRGRDRHRPGRTSRQRRGVAVVDDRSAGRRGCAGPDGGAAHRRRRHAGGDLAAERDDRGVGRGRGFGAEQHRDDRGRHDRRRVGFDPDQPDGQGDEPLHSRDRRRRFRRRRCGAQRRRRRRQARQVHLGRRCRDPDGLRQPGDRGPGLRPGRRAGPARRQGHGQHCSKTRVCRSSTRSTRWPAGCPGT